ncbi:formyltransferase family protein [Synechococcus sp. CC9616]|uniref:formyltransferase family protein n=1 Tax=Synechococcus sp. CC9616 TaxID=110663 RepID=UPI00068663AD|nr:formyltransferase family protein [Synechococcus sp. CC9616]
MSPSIVVFADAEVGFCCTQWLIDNYKSDLTMVVTTSQNQIFDLAKNNGVSSHVFQDDISYLRSFNVEETLCDIGLLLWWPSIISPSIINSARHGFVNTHPSFLPFNRGKNYNFWALVEECTFGVSIHTVEEGIDCGDIISQKKINYTWEDTGETLYFKAIAGMKELVFDTYPLLRQLRFPRKKQDLSKGSFHFSSELEPASIIALDQPTTPRQLFNVLRARTFQGYPACRFLDNGVEYEVRIDITERE